MCESKRKREEKKEKVRCMYKLFILTHTDLYGMTPITDLYTHALSFTHTHAQFAFHSWNAICESPTASTLHRQHYSTVLTVRPCRKYREKERARQEEGKWRRAESRWGKEDNSTLAVFLTSVALKKPLLLREAIKSACLPDVIATEHQMQTATWGFYKNQNCILKGVRSEKCSQCCGIIIAISIFYVQSMSKTRRVQLPCNTEIK